MEHRLDALLAGAAGSDPHAATAAVADLLRERPPPGAVARAVQRIPTRALADAAPAPRAAARQHIHTLWSQSLATWQARDPLRTQNAAELVAALAGALLARNLPPLTMLGLMCHSVASADTDLAALVAAVTQALQATASKLPEPDAVREAEATIQLLLVWLARAGRSSLASTFLQPDLFPQLRVLLASAAPHAPALTPMVARISLILALMYTSACVPASLRLTPQGTLDTAAAAAHASKYAHHLAAWDARGELLSVASATVSSFNQAIAAYDPEPTHPAADPANQTWAEWISSSIWPTSAPKRSSQAPKMVPNALPPKEASLLLPVFFFSNLNHRFLDVLLTPAPDGTPAMAPTLSLSSYLATNASISPRAASYAHLALSTLSSILLRAPTACSVPLDASTVCLSTARYGQPSLPAPAWLASPPRQGGPTTAHYTLYVACCFMRHNLARRLDGAGHMLALRVWALSLSALARAQTPPTGKGMDWAAIWTAVVGVPLFLHTKFDSLERTYVSGAKDVTRAAIFALAQGIALAPQALPAVEARALVYEVVRAEEGLASLAKKVSPSPLPGWNVITAVTQAVKTQLGPSPGRLTRSTVAKAIDRIDLPSLLATLPSAPHVGAGDDLLSRLGLAHPEPAPRGTLSSAVWAVAENACAEP